MKACGPTNLTPRMTTESRFLGFAIFVFIAVPVFGLMQVLWVLVWRKRYSNHFGTTVASTFALGASIYAGVLILLSQMLD